MCHSQNFTYSYIVEHKKLKKFLKCLSILFQYHFKRKKQNSLSN